MEKLKFRIRLNKGRKGIPLSKMADISAHTLKFIESVCEDIAIKTEEWVALDFKNGSLEYAVENFANVNAAQIKTFNEEMGGLMNGGIEKSRLSLATRVRYAKIASPIDPDEVVEFGLYKNGGKEPSWHELSKEKSTNIVSGIQTEIEGIGAVQGVPHTWHKESTPPYFTFRELSSDVPMKCFYKKSDYSIVHSLFKTKTAIVHIGGTVTYNVVGRNIEKIAANKYEVAPDFTDEDFEKFFGCAHEQLKDSSVSKLISSARRGGH